MQLATPLTLLKLALLASLGWLSVADILIRAEVMTYSGDEIYNLDAVMSLLTTGDYTTRHFGGFPFDPAISSGVLVTWPYGLVFSLGGNLFTARALTGLLHLAAITGLGLAFFRSRGAGRLDGAILALGVWVGLLRVLSHEQRIVNPGEMWGFVFLLAGMFRLGRSTRAAALVWGLATWLCKIIYAPFAAAFLLAAWVVDARAAGFALASRAGLHAGLRIALPFFAPLAAWMALIWLRHDTRTLLGWCAANVSFVVEHAAGHELALDTGGGLEGWRFDPGWPEPTSFLSWSPDVTLPSLVPLALGPLAYIVLVVLARRGSIRVLPRESAYLASAVAAVSAFACWFLAFDPTQWGRHLMPALYVSVAVAVYCVTTMWQQLTVPVPIRALAPIAYAVMIATGGAHARAYADEVSGQGSYSRTCRGHDVLGPPCWQGAAAHAVSELVQELCALPGGSFDESCVRDERTELLRRAAAVASVAPTDPATAHEAGYMVLFVQRWAYLDEADFIADLAPLLCAGNNPELRRYLEEAALDVSTISRDCPAPRARNG